MTNPRIMICNKILIVLGRDHIVRLNGVEVES